MKADPEQAPRPAHLPPAIVSGQQAKPIIRMINKVLLPKIRRRGATYRGKITTPDVKVTEKKIRYW